MLYVVVDTGGSVMLSVADEFSSAGFWMHYNLVILSYWLTYLVQTEICWNWKLVYVRPVELYGMPFRPNMRNVSYSALLKCVCT